MLIIAHFVECARDLNLVKFKHGEINIEFGNKNINFLLGETSFISLDIEVKMCRTLTILCAKAH